MPGSRRGNPGVPAGPWNRFSAAIQRMDGAARIGLFLVCWLALSFALHFVLTSVAGPEAGLFGHTGPGRAVTYLLFLASAAVFLMPDGPDRLAALGARPEPGCFPRVLRGWMYGIAGFAFYMGFMLAAGVVQWRGPEAAARIPAALPTAFAAGLAVAAAEELLFRGFLLRTAAQALPRRAAIVFVGLLFGFFHDLANPLDFILEPADRMLFGGVFCLHLLLCAAVARTRGLFLGFGIHAGLVFGEALARKARLFKTLEDESWLLGLDGDPRRGFAAWALFLASILVLPWLAGRRASPPGSANSPLAFAAASPPWLARIGVFLTNLPRPAETALWAAVLAAALFARGALLCALPFPLAHYDTAARLPGLAANASNHAVAAPFPNAALTAVWNVAPGPAALPALQHFLVLAALAGGFALLRAWLGRAAALPLAAAAFACALHAQTLAAGHLLHPAAIGFAATAATLGCFGVWLVRGCSAAAALAGLGAALAQLCGVWTFPLLLVMAGACMVQPRAPAAAMSLLAAWLVSLLAAAAIWPESRSHPLLPRLRAADALGSLAHLGTLRGLLAPEEHTALDAALKSMASGSSGERASRFRNRVLPLLERARLPEETSEAAAWRAVRHAFATRPRDAAAVWGRALLERLQKSARSNDSPARADLDRSRRLGGAVRDTPSAQWRGAQETAAADGETPRRLAAVAGLSAGAWLFKIAPPMLAAVLACTAAFFTRDRVLAWLGAGCLALLLPALAPQIAVIDANERDLIAVLPAVFLPLALLVALGTIPPACRAPSSPQPLGPSRSPGVKVQD